VLQDAVGDQAAEVAGAGDQHALEADAGAPRRSSSSRTVSRDRR
jgi:hypothetical protein